jgi:hypothetical protein
VLKETKLIKRFPGFYGTWIFITMFTSACEVAIYNY